MRSQLKSFHKYADFGFKHKNYLSIWSVNPVRVLIPFKLCRGDWLPEHDLIKKRNTSLSLVVGNNVTFKPRRTPPVSWTAFFTFNVKD